MVIELKDGDIGALEEGGMVTKAFYVSAGFP
jgi:hypothetical protein